MAVLFEWPRSESGETGGVLAGKEQKQKGQYGITGKLIYYCYASEDDLTDTGF